MCNQPSTTVVHFKQSESLMKLDIRYSTAFARRISTFFRLPSILAQEQVSDLQKYVVTTIDKSITNLYNCVIDLRKNREGGLCPACGIFLLNSHFWDGH